MATKERELTEKRPILYLPYKLNKAHLHTQHDAAIVYNPVILPKNKYLF